MQNLPTMAAAAHSHSTYAAGDLSGLNLGLQSGFASSNALNYAAANSAPIQTHQMQKGPIMAQRRVVQVFIADPNENISLDDCILFRGDEKVTDATDQELFFELDIKNLLETHNAKRVKVIDKKIKDRTEYLEPAKVRDLKMVVVTVANL